MWSANGGEALVTFGKKAHKISKWQLAYHSKFTPWMKRAARGHERAAQKRDWKREKNEERD